MKRGMLLGTCCLFAVLFAGRATADERRGKKPSKGSKKVHFLVQTYLECAVKKDSACMRESLGDMDNSKLRKPSCALLASRFPELGEEVHVAAAAALAELYCEEVAQVAVGVFSQTDIDTRGAVAAELARTKNRKLVAPIKELVEKGRPYDKEKGCEALALIGDKEAIPVLVKASSNSMFSVRVAATQALAVFPSNEAREALCAIVTADTNTGVRAKAADSLAILKDMKSVPSLIKALADKENAVKIAVHRALVAVTGLDVGTDVESWTRWWEKNKPTKKRRR